jgi:hypothetical protein
MAGRVILAMVVLAGAQKLAIAAVAAIWRGNIYRAVMVVAILAAPATWWFAPSLAGDALTANGRLYVVLLQLAIGGFLFHFMTLPDRSVTLRVLAEIELAPGRTLSLQALAARYSVRDMIVSRLAQMAEAGFIAIDATGGITILPRGVAFGRFVTNGRRLFGITSAN